MTKRPRGTITAKKEADHAFAQFIKHRDGWRCVICGHKSLITCGHLFSRVAMSTRFDPTNAYAQCRGCNFLHESNPHVFTLWYLLQFGQAAYETLYRRYYQTRQMKLADYVEIASEFQELRENIRKPITYRVFPEVRAALKDNRALRDKLLAEMNRHLDIG